MIAQDAKPITTEVYHCSFPEEISAQVVHNTANGNTMIGTNHKLVDVRHDLIAISRFVSQEYAKRALAMVALSILVGTIALLAL
jgi:hypothetical protein